MRTRVNEELEGEVHVGGLRSDNPNPSLPPTLCLNLYYSLMFPPFTLLHALRYASLITRFFKEYLRAQPRLPNQADMSSSEHLSQRSAVLM